jgi:glyoxylase-like metal-dependent hydrolase (beta-lactamase superfamily II)
MRKISIGDIDMFPVLQLRHHMTAERLFGDVSSIDTDAWYWREPYFDTGRDMIPVDMGGFLIRTPTHQVIVDLGVGNDKVERPTPNFVQRHDDWFERLAALGVTPADVDAIVITHFHVDHVGYATTLLDGRWEVTFKGVPHYVGEGELDFWGHAGDRSTAEQERLGGYMGDSVLPVREAGLLHYVGTGFEVAPGLTIEAHPGHTPGTIALVAESNGEGAIFVGDMIHQAAQLADPGRSTTYCIDPVAAAVARRAVLERAADTGYLLVPAHFPNALPGRITRAAEGFAYETVEGVDVA